MAHVLQAEGTQTGEDRMKVGAYWDHGPIVWVGTEADSTWFTIYRPRFWRHENGWWLAPLIRIGKGKAPNGDETVYEIPWIERSNRRLRVRLVDRS